MRELFADRRRAAALVLAAVVSVALLIWLRMYGEALHPEAVRDRLHALNLAACGIPLGQAMLVLVLAAVLVVPVIPATILQIGSGLAFGPEWGLLYVLLADLIGAGAGFWLARRWGPSLLDRWLRPATVARTETLARRLDWKGVIILRLLPGPVYPLVSFAAGLSRLTAARYLLASFAGVLPSLTILVFAGDVATSSPLTAVLIVAVLVASLAIAGRIFRRSE